MTKELADTMHTCEVVVSDLRAGVTVNSGGRQVLKASLVQICFCFTVYLFVMLSAFITQHSTS